MRITTFELSKLLHCNFRKAARLAIVLSFAREMQGHRLTYVLPPEHPFTQSIKLIKDHTITKPIYSLSELSTMWTWHKGNYSKERVRQLLTKYSIPIQNRNRKGYVYLVDIKKLMNL